MSADAKTVSEREAVLRERKACVKGAQNARLFPSARTNEDYERTARLLYPLPTVTRPRVVTDPHGGPKIQWSTAMQFGRIRITYSNGDGFELYPTTGHTAYPTPDRVALWADLLANPTEEIAE